jgi:hypothetical protein
VIFIDADSGTEAPHVIADETGSDSQQTSLPRSQDRRRMRSRRMRSPLAVHVQVNVTLQRIFEAVVADINSTLVVPNAARCLEMFGGVSCVPQVLV